MESSKPQRVEPTPIPVLTYTLMLRHEHPTKIHQIHTIKTLAIKKSELMDDQSTPEKNE